MTASLADTTVTPGPQTKQFRLAGIRRVISATWRGTRNSFVWPWPPRGEPDQHVALMREAPGVPPSRRSPGEAGSGVGGPHRAAVARHADERATPPASSTGEASIVLRSRLAKATSTHRRADCPRRKNHRAPGGARSRVCALAERREAARPSAPRSPRASTSDTPSTLPGRGRGTPSHLLTPSAAPAPAGARVTSRQRHVNCVTRRGRRGATRVEQGARLDVGCLPSRHRANRRVPRDAERAAAVVRAPWGATQRVGRRAAAAGEVRHETRAPASTPASAALQARISRGTRHQRGPQMKRFVFSPPPRGEPDQYVALMREAPGAPPLPDEVPPMPGVPTLSCVPEMAFHVEPPLRATPMTEPPAPPPP